MNTGDQNMTAKSRNRAPARAISVARWFINRANSEQEAGESITHLKAQKLLYYAQCWYLVNYDRPLFNEPIQAWTHGPVCPRVWKSLQEHGFSPIDRKYSTNVSQDVAEFLEAVYGAYGKFSARELERMTHEEAPWRDARGNTPLGERCNADISHESMREFYSKRLN